MLIQGAKKKKEKKLELMCQYPISILNADVIPGRLAPPS